LELIRSHRGTAGAQIRGEPRNEAAKFVAMVADLNSDDSDLVAAQQLYIS